MSASFSLVTLTTLRARDVMSTDAITIADYEKVETAIALLTTHGCRFVPVVRDHKVVGVIDDRLVAQRLREEADHTRPVGEAAVPATTVHHGATLPEVIDRLIDTEGDHLVVVDDDGHVVGVVTAITVVRLLDAALARAGH
jgi:CBS domain-containing protein